MSVENGKYEAIYYPDCYPKSLSVFASSALYFDKVNFVTPSSMTSESEKHTEFLKTLSKDDFRVYAMLGDNHRSREEYGLNERSLSRMLEYYEFISKISGLLSEVVYYHPNLLNVATNRIQKGLISGEGVTIGELFKVMNGETEEQSAIREFIAANPDLNDGIRELVLPTARHLAIQNNWISISDDSTLPTPVVENPKQSAYYLAAVIALELLSISLPAAEFTDSEDILAARDELSGELTDFRVMMVRMAADLRNQLSDNVAHDTIRKEARFLIDTKIEPVMYEVRKKIADANKKLMMRLFGKSIKYIPLVIGSFLDPTSVCITKAIQEGIKDARELLAEVDSIKAISSTGISYLLKVEELSTNPN